MSSEAWTEVVRRAAMSRFSGVTAEDDDLLAMLDIAEAQLNPNRAGGAGGMAPPMMMMPPMMMGGMRGGGGGGDAGRLGGGAPAASGMAPQGLPQPSATVPVTQSKAATAGPVAAEAEPGALGASPGIGGLPGGGAPAGADSGTTAGSGTGLPGSGAPSPGGGAASASDSPDPGYTADPTVVRDLGGSWADAAESLPAQEQQADTDQEGGILGLVVAADRPERALAARLGMWLGGASKELDAMSARLHKVASQYEAAEDAGAAQARKGMNQ